MWTLPASETCARFPTLASPAYAAETVRRRLVGPADRASMLALLDEYFEGVSASRFERDLEEKDWVILLKSRASGELAGFTTFMRFACAAEPGVVAFFSGDTIVRREAWTETLLARAWAQLSFGLASRETDKEVYWFLICSGFRTYRFLPVYFREFHPRFNSATPARAAQIAARLASAKFGDEYDGATGVVRPAWPTPLRAAAADLPSHPDPHVSFFLASNAGHLAGHELVCLARLAADNLTAAGRRMSGLR
jgi:hypothetical protein